MGRFDQVIGYHPEDDELVIASSGEGVIWFSLFNMRHNSFVNEDIGFPFFSPSRQHIVSLHRSGVLSPDHTVRVYRRDGDFFRLLFESEERFQLDMNNYRDTDRVSWEDDHTATVHHNGIDVLRVRIDGNLVEVYEPPFSASVSGQLQVNTNLEVSPNKGHYDN